MEKKKRKNRDWWRLSRKTLRVLACIFAASMICCFYPPILDDALWAMDVRLWPLWYFAAWGLIFLFSLKWFSIYVSVVLDKAVLRTGEKLFLYATGTISVILTTMVACSVVRGHGLGTNF